MRPREHPGRAAPRSLFVCGWHAPAETPPGSHRRSAEQRSLQRAGCARGVAPAVPYLHAAASPPREYEDCACRPDSRASYPGPLAPHRSAPAAPTVERSTVWIDTVKRGSVLRQVRGLGTLVPVEIQWIPAITEGRVDKIRELPGTQVKPDTVILELSTPQLQQETLDAEWKLKAAEADYKNFEVTIASQVLSQKSAVAKIQSEYSQAKRADDTDTVLHKFRLLSRIAMR